MLDTFRLLKKGVSIGLSVTDQGVALLAMDTKENKKNKISIKESLYLDVNIDRDIEQCMEELKYFIDKKKFKKADCHCVLNNNEYQLLLMEPAEVPEDELRDAMRWRVNEVVEQNIDDVVVQLFQQPEKNMVYTAVSDKKKIQSLVKKVADLDLNLLSIDIEELSYRNFFENYFLVNKIKNRYTEELNINVEKDERGLAVIDIGADEGRVLILKKGKLFLTRKFAISYGGGEFDELPEDEVILELQRSLDYYERQMKQPPPTEIVFCGLVSVEKITETIKKTFQQSIECVDVSSILNIQDNLFPTDDFIKVCGAALKDVVD